MNDNAVAAAASPALNLRKVAAWRGIRVLAWDGDVLYGCRGYQILRLQAGKLAEWENIATFRPAWWRNLTYTQRAELSTRARWLSCPRDRRQPDRRADNR